MGNRSFLEKGGKEYRLEAEGTLACVMEWIQSNFGDFFFIIVRSMIQNKMEKRVLMISKGACLTEWVNKDFNGFANEAFKS